MPTQRKPPAAAVVVGLVLAALVVLVVVGRAGKRGPAPKPVPPGTAAPDPDRIAVLTAMRNEATGNFPAAYAPLVPHLDAHPDDVGALQVLRRVLPRGDKSELAARLGRCSDADVAFDALYNDALADGDALALRVLLGWLKANRPDDHRWACAEIEEKVAAKRYPEATELFRRRLTITGNESTQAQMFLTYLDTMQSAGRQGEAYAAVPDADARAAFARLAHRLELRLLSDPAAERPPLRELIDAHRKRSPADPRLWYAEGVLLEAAGEFEKADKLYADGRAKLPPTAPPRPGEPTWEDEMFRTRRVECLLKLNQPRRAYAEVGPPDRTFRQLAFHLAADKKADAMAELVAAHRAALADGSLPFWEAEVLFLRGEYAKAAAALEAFRAGKRADLPERWRVYDRLVRCHLRAKNPDAAARVVEDSGPAKLALNPSLLAAVRAATGDADAVAVFLSTTQSLPAFYLDEDFAREFADPKFTELRAKYPDPRNRKP